ncbi:hypothetical protein HW450_01485 [Corynebacterium hindlerae]|uniref:Uncharacterized protein n=1 Tax=Corynebacterium hindlerae TaxID=699041 RepID=A0A7G5FFR1_9CORY|nr:hypothetical protein [Corynebacterium hindlerae]QMV85452.1 hypothetical protein HW450_01485 [Corynebacterium hindlerae]QTH58669.1 hypothetical protein J5O04_07330 [Corynebacterium hindlerae]
MFSTRTLYQPLSTNRDDADLEEEKSVAAGRALWRLYIVKFRATGDR